MKIQKNISGVSYRLLLTLAAAAAVVVYAASSLPLASALVGQVNEDQVTLNPGGGVMTNGSDGMRFTINSVASAGNPDYASAGADGVVYKNTYQYCCTVGAPSLNIGGKLYGQAGAAYSGSVDTWSSIDIISTSGSASVGNRTSTTGSAAATVRYAAVKNGLTYIMDREVTYTYPNDFVSDKYTFTIPAGNTEAVKFYLGGDTAPGSSDSGYGIMLTSPVRSIISLNTSSQIMFGFREDPESKPFDGATSQHYSTPYTAVQLGNNIGFVGTASNHDAGLMMQWNLGSTPGTQTATLEQFVTSQGTNVNASFSAAKTKPNIPVNLNVSVANTVLSPVGSLGLTFTLPTGLRVGSGTLSNSCNGTLTAVVGTSSVELSGGNVGAGTNCLISVPVVSSSVGIYTISSNSVSVGAGLSNNVGMSSLSVISDNDADGVNDEIEDGAPNSGDGNNDGTADAEQLNVTSLVNSVTGEYSTIVTDSACELNAVDIKSSNGLTQDNGYIYPMGLFDFSADCGTPGFETTITQYFFEPPTSDFILRKYNNGAYATVADAVMSNQTIGGQNVLAVTYKVVDGGALDEDGITNGVIVDPAGPAQAVVGVPNTGAGRLLSIWQLIAVIISAAVLLFIAVMQLFLPIKKQRA